jgi:4-hydroxy-2-oxoheptanedioate aldolase
MRKSRLRAKLSQDLPALITTLNFMDTSLFEMVSLMGFDAIWIDLEHHGHSVETAAQMMRAARVGSADILVRPAKGEFLRMARMLEVGANAMMYPQCDSAAEAAEFVHWTKFPPMGRRGCDASNADMPYMSQAIEEYLVEANEQLVNIVQVETLEALNEVEAIAEVPGVDVLFLGPGDLSIRMGIPGQIHHPKIQAAAERIAKAAKNAGKHWGKPVGSSEEAAQAIELGARFITHQSDIALIKQGYEAIQQSFASVGFQFENRLRRS